MLPNIWTLIGQFFGLLAVLGVVALIISIPIWLYRISRNTQRLADLKEQEMQARHAGRADEH